MSAPRKKPVGKPGKASADKPPAKAKKAAGGDGAHKAWASVPEPIELAKLAALLSPEACKKSGAKIALEKAMAFYMGAVHVRSEFTSLSSVDFWKKIMVSE